jgi:hypothetical protein
MKNLGYNQQFTAITGLSNRRMTSNESITEGSAQKFTDVPFASQSAAHNNFMDQSNFNAASILQNNGILEQRAQSVQAVPIVGLNYNSQPVGMTQPMHQASANIPINHGTAVLNTG